MPLRLYTPAEIGSTPELVPLVENGIRGRGQDQAGSVRSFKARVASAVDRQLLIDATKEPGARRPRATRIPGPQPLGLRTSLVSSAAQAETPQWPPRYVPSWVSIRDLRTSSHEWSGTSST